MVGEPIDPIRVEHVGSLVRPPSLVEALGAFGRDEVSADVMRSTIDQAVRAVVVEQDARGLSLLTDGEFRRVRIAGDEDRGAKASQPAALRWQRAFSSPNHEGRIATLDRHGHAHTDALDLEVTWPVEEYSFSRALTSRPVKVALPAPDQVVSGLDAELVAGRRGSDAVLADVVATVHASANALLDAGCRHVQIDAPLYATFGSIEARAHLRGLGQDPTARLEWSLWADNAVIGDASPAMFGIHICTGGAASHEHGLGLDDATAERVFSSLRHGRLLLDLARCSSLEYLRFVPKDKAVVLGLVSVRPGPVESVDALLRSIESVSRFISVDQLAIGPSCGFASPLNAEVAGADSTAADEQWRRIDVLLETAERVWGVTAA